MKKVLAIALVAILVASSAFATFSGSATIGAGANFDNGNYGFITKDTNVKFNVDLATASAEAIAEGDVYASIKGSLSVFVLNDADGTGTGDPLSFVVVTDDTKKSVGLVLKATIDEAKVAGNNWYVSLLGVPGVNDFAKSAIDSWTVENELDDYGIPKADYDKYATYKIGYEKAPGVEVGVYDYVAGFGFIADANKADGFEPFAKYAASFYAKTPEYTLVDGLKLQAGASYAVANGNVGSYTKGEINALGGSVKVSYVADALSTSVASDIGYDFKAEKFGIDVAANVAYDFLTFDAYYAKDVTVDGAAVENLLSAQVVTDLNSFEVPVKLTVTAKDLVNAQDTKLKAEVKVSDVKLTPSVGYVFSGANEGKFSAGLDAEYKVDAFTAKASVGTETKFKENDLILKASASIETKALVPGATLKLAWSDAKDLLKNGTASTKYGKVVASCKIEF